MDMRKRNPSENRPLIALIVVLLCFLLLCSCGEKNEMPETPDDTTETEGEKQQEIEQESNKETSVTVGGKVFSPEEINTGMQRTLQNILYLYGNDEDSAYIFHNQSRILHQKIEYDLFFREIADGGAGHPTKVYFRITNFLHPLSTEDRPLLYEFGIDLTEKGLRSHFYFEGRSERDGKASFEREDTVYLGRFALRIDAVSKPTYETMGQAWADNTKQAISLYMDENDFSSEEKSVLQAGRYTVYVQGFWESDEDSTVIFVHENGAVYSGWFYFVHDVRANMSADLNKVALVENASDENFLAYLQRVKDTCALTMEYVVEKT